jgi:hypothetical protein
VEPFAAAVVAARGDAGGLIAVDEELRQPLEWYLRDESVAFGEPGEGVSVYVAQPGATVEGFAPQERVWRLDEGWFPPSAEIVKIWRWLLYRTPFSTLSSRDAQIYLPES